MMPPECNCSGKAIRDGNFKVPCAKMNGRFMAKNDLMMEVEHPQKWVDKEHYGHLLRGPVTFPAYSFACTPYRWLLKKNIEKILGSAKRKRFSREVKVFDPVPELENTNSSWIMDGENQRSVFDHFFYDVLPEKSLVVAYAQRVPFYEGYKKVIIGVGHVRKVINAVPFNTEASSQWEVAPKKPSAMTWETMIYHSIRDDHRDGFLIPYQQMIDYALEHPEFDINSIIVTADNNAGELSYATEHLSNDRRIDILLSCLKSFQIINNFLDDDYSNVIDWLNERIIEIWQQRGAFPGLGAMLCAINIEQGVLLANEINDIKPDDIWETLKNVFDEPYKYLTPDLADTIHQNMKNIWQMMPNKQ